MALLIDCVAIDANDPRRLAAFWAGALGWVEDGTEPGEDEVMIKPPADSSQRLLFLRVPGGKDGKNRLHLDLRPSDQEAEVARLEAMGAHRVDIGQGEQTWVVLADPEGNEFCVLRALRADELENAAASE